MLNPELAVLSVPFKMLWQRGIVNDDISNFKLPQSGGKKSGKKSKSQNDEHDGGFFKVVEDMIRKF